jgi:L,D-transpeptidase ErfK/SrfK
LADDNGLDYNAKLMPGQRLKIDNRHIAASIMLDGILINLPQRMLYYFEAGALRAAYPVGLGRPEWPTPTGTFSVSSKALNKTWRVPKSIQEEMRREAKVVQTEVPPGADNPLGKHWLGMTIAGIGIHGTIAPSSIYQFRSHGCIRLHGDDIAALFTEIALGTSGHIVYAPLLLTEADGRILLEVHADIYQQGDVSLAALAQLADDAELSPRINWPLAHAVLQQRAGIARDITLMPDSR